MTDKSVYACEGQPSHGWPVLGPRVGPFVLALLSIVVFLATGCSNQVRFTDTSRSGPVVVLGDSLSEGYEIPKEETYVSVLSKRLDLEIVNLGIKGITTRESLPRVKEEVIPLQPSLVILQLGGNDALQKVDVEVTKSNLQSMIDQLHQEEIPVLILGVRGGVLNDKFADMFEQLASDNGLAYVPDILDGLLTNPSLRVDNIHPNGKGHELIADRVEPVLKPLLEKLGVK